MEISENEAVLNAYCEYYTGFKVNFPMDSFYDKNIHINSIDGLEIDFHVFGRRGLW